MNTGMITGRRKFLMAYVAEGGMSGRIFVTANDGEFTEAFVAQVENHIKEEMTKAAGRDIASVAVTNIIPLEKVDG
jgi:hypothetical protein